MFCKINVDKLDTKSKRDTKKNTPEKSSSWVLHLRSVYQEVMVMILLTRTSRMALITAFMDSVYPVTPE